MTTLRKCPACGVTVEVPDDAPLEKARCGQCGVPLASAGRDDRVTRRAPRASARSRRERDEEDDELPQPRWRRPRRSVVLEKVRWPATLLMVKGGIYCVAAAGLLVLLPLLAFQKRPDPGALAVCVLGAALALLAGGFSIVGGLQMRALRNYGLVMASLVVASVVGFLVCIPLAAPPIWPLIVLLDPEVKACFDREADE
jgi:hypothetical protein